MLLDYSIVHVLVDIDYRLIVLLMLLDYSIVLVDIDYSAVNAVRL